MHAIDQSFPQGVQGKSENSREWISKPFGATPKGYIDYNPLQANPSKRFVATAIILGDRRPYRVEVSVWEERRHEHADGGANYERTRENSRMAELIADQIDKYLVKSRSKRDLIDDFRAF